MFSTPSLGMKSVNQTGGDLDPSTGQHPDYFGEDGYHCKDAQEFYDRYKVYVPDVPRGYHNEPLPTVKGQPMLDAKKRIPYALKTGMKYVKVIGGPLKQMNRWKGYYGEIVSRSVGEESGASNYEYC